MPELPLFPLHTVLFPGIPFQLHIFEERYKQMIARCLDERLPIGVVLIKRGREALGPLAETYTVGCTAQIARVEQLPQGRFNLTVVGRERFRILALRYDMPYLVGQVTLHPLEVWNELAVQRAGEALRPLVIRYLGLLAQASEVAFHAPDLPARPLKLAYLAAHILQTPLTRKQDLLSRDQALAFIQGLRDLYPREIALLRAILERQGEPAPDPGQFSLN